jgi:hypothetical protein
MLRSTRAGQAAEPRFRPVSRWITAAAYAVPLCVLPSALWRLWALADGLPRGCRQAGPAWEPYYVTGLSVVSLSAALLTIGLVRPWGEVLPHWIPLVGGRTVPVRAAVTAASLGTIFIFGVYAYALLNPIFRFRVAPDIPGCPSPLEGPGAWVAVASYAPLLAWGPLLAVVTVAYYRRRTHTTTAPPSTAGSSTLRAAG